MKLSSKSIIANLAVYGLIHALVDGICAGIAFSMYTTGAVTGADFGILLILYNALAFALQPLAGLISDNQKSPGLIALCGCAFTAIAVLLSPLTAVGALLVAGIGNTLFHVGGGSISLGLTPKKASAPGIFVAFGAVGITAGTLLGKNGQFSPLPALVLLVAAIITILLLKQPLLPYREKPLLMTGKKLFMGILALLLLAVAARALAGSVIVFPWKSDLGLLWLLTAGVFLGKGLGGLLADKLGWTRTAVGSLLLALPLLVFFNTSPLPAIIGISLFNVAMPVTLTAVANLFPGRPGFAFGLTTLALFLGGLPAFFPLKATLGESIAILITIAVAAVAIYFGLRKLYLIK